MSDKMKPCPNPWCGHKHDGPHLEKFGPTVASMWNVTCFCETTGPCAAKPSDAIAAWNTRPDPAKDALVAALREVRRKHLSYSRQPMWGTECDDDIRSASEIIDSALSGVEE